MSQFHKIQPSPEELQKGKIGFMKSDPQRQNYRKKIHIVSNNLGNYYFPKIHKRSWWPNGPYLVKRRYEHCEIGLRHWFEKNNVEQLRDIEDPNEERKDNQKIYRKFIRNFPEYEIAGDNEYIITIEYCSNCAEHSKITQHSREMYQRVALNYQKIIQLRFPFIKVLLKPIDVNIVKEEDYKAPPLPPNGYPFAQTQILNDNFKPCRIGAFEIQMFNKEKNVQMIHSKLYTKQWPHVETILNKIISCIPRLDLMLIIYDKEDYTEKEKMDNIQVNLYLIKKEDIDELIENTEYLIGNCIDPGMRLETMKMNNRLKKEEMYMDNNELTARKTFLHNSKNSNIDCDLSQQKGKLIMRKYTNIENDIVIQQSQEKQSNKDMVRTHLLFENIPYDTYIIETIENCNFSASLKKLNFFSIQSEKLVEKYIGLLHQNKAIIRVQPYLEVLKEIEPKKEEEPKQEKKYEVEFVPARPSSILLTNLTSLSIISICSDRNGIYQLKVEPGKYKIEINDHKFEEIVKKVILERGLNSMIIKLTPERKCEILITVYAYQFEENKNENQDMKESSSENRFIPIQNAEIEFYKSSSEKFYEGITDPDGNLLYIANTYENKFTIIVNKAGYYPCQRFFSKNKSMKVNETTGQYQYKMDFILISEQSLNKSQSIIFVSYSNLNQKILEFVPKKFEREDNQEISMKVNDTQNENGIVLAKFDYKEQQENNQIDDFNDENLYEEIVRLGFKYSPDSENKEHDKDNTIEDEIDYLNTLCFTGMIYAPFKAFTINMPNTLCPNPQEPKEEKEEEQEEKEENELEEKEDKEQEEKPEEGEGKEHKNGLYWDLGWLDIKNQLFYETSAMFKISETPLRTQFFEEWIDFLQKIIDEKINKNIFDYFDFKNSLLTECDRFIDKLVFSNIVRPLLLAGEDENNPENESLVKKVNKAIDFIISTVTIEDRTVETNSTKISYQKFKKKLVSNLKNFISEEEEEEEIDH